MLFEGKMIAGEFDGSTNEFVLQRIKHHYTETTLNKGQMQKVLGYLEKHQHEEGQILSLFDQMLVRLSGEEVAILLSELAEVEKSYQ
ncbi:hypothetical protein WQ57_08285 [Mesobacillus campisalis]|uniref:Uncharacterized protein n=1 Tax=Mesobacillus campisalis TaxID=1408103 RepID=A0A0M2SWN6_9BACI|nr:hypothetical protein [Mesobacillus campisalis]KKK38583.1 hypothetical protein WQ57_08285 [Mesobacillus campisalis]